jgi:uncharacterized protein YoxC
MDINIPKDFNSKNTPECQGIEEAVKRFENIMLSRIYVQQRLGDRLKNSIRIGMVILFLLAISIFTLLLTLSIQINRVGESIVHMNQSFGGIAQNMNRIDSYMTNMESQVAYLPKIKDKTEIFDQQMGLMNHDFLIIKNEIRAMSDNISLIENKMKSMSYSVSQMDDRVGLITQDTHRMSKPAKNINKLFPF